MKKITFLAVAAAVLSLQAVPRVDLNEVTFSQDATRKATIRYRLTGEPGVVTFDIQTNYVENAETKWASIGAENLSDAVGDVYKLVQNSDSETKSFHWIARKAWPDRKIEAGGIRAVVYAWATNAPPEYCVIDLAGTSAPFYYTHEAQLPLGISNEIYRTERLVLRRIPAAGVEYRKGRAGATSGDEVPYRVSFSDDFYIGVFELTQGQYYNLFKANPSGQKQTGADRHLHPCIVSYADMRGVNTWPEDGHVGIGSSSVCGKLFLLSGMVFDLPTSAQWEYACRAGSGSLYYYGDDASILGDYAWYAANSGSASHHVGTRIPNAWGLYDTLGNMLEWVLDWRCNSPNLLGQSVNPEGPATGSPEAVARQNQRLLRGGAWNVTSESATCAGGKGGGAYTATSNAGVYGARVCAPAIAVR